jgi:hypothetical protein
MEMELYDGESGITDKQKIPSTRCSDRLQGQLVKKYVIPAQGVAQKRTIEGTNLSAHNSFAILDDSDIMNLAADMGIIIDSGQFEMVNIMKDLEIARHSLDKVKLHEIKNP